MKAKLTLNLKHQQAHRMTNHKEPNSTPSSNNDSSSTSEAIVIKVQALHDGHPLLADRLIATQAPYRSANRRPLRYSLAMKLAAARAAAAQPRLLAVTSNVVTWREATFSTRNVT